jgi:hypothetical protein
MNNTAMYGNTIESHFILKLHNAAIQYDTGLYRRSNKMRIISGKDVLRDKNFWLLYCPALCVSYMNLPHLSVDYSLTELTMDYLDWPMIH